MASDIVNEQALEATKNPLVRFCYHRTLTSLDRKPGLNNIRFSIGFPVFLGSPWPPTLSMSKPWKSPRTPSYVSATTGPSRP